MKKILTIISILILLFIINILSSSILEITPLQLIYIYLDRLLLPITCPLRNGEIIPYNFDGTLTYCRLEYSDASKICYEKKDCQGACILENRWLFASDYNFHKFKLDPDNLTLFVMDDQQADRFLNKKGNCQKYHDLDCFVERNNNKIILHTCQFAHIY